jgi:hypothetical protein
MSLSKPELMSLPTPYRILSQAPRELRHVNDLEDRPQPHNLPTRNVMTLNHTLKATALANPVTLREFAVALSKTWGTTNQARPSRTIGMWFTNESFEI